MNLALATCGFPVYFKQVHLLGTFPVGGVLGGHVSEGVLWVAFVSVE